MVSAAPLTIRYGETELYAAGLNDDELMVFLVLMFVGDLMGLAQRRCQYSSATLLVGRAAVVVILFADRG
jgi:hypothetical protein